MNEWRNPSFNFLLTLYILGQISWPCLVCFLICKMEEGWIPYLIMPLSLGISGSVSGVAALTQWEVCSMGPQEGKILKGQEQRWFL